MGNLVDTLRSELSSEQASVVRLEREISIVQERLRLAMEKTEKIKGLLLLYESEAPSVAASTPTLEPQHVVAEPLSLTASPPTPAWKANTKKAKLEREITALVSLRGTIHRSQILEHLAQKGLVGGEKNPMAQLAAFLSDHREKFVPDGKGNFALRRNGASEPLPAPSGAGSADGRNPGTDPGLPFNRTSH